MSWNPTGMFGQCSILSDGVKWRWCKRSLFCDWLPCVRIYRAVSFLTIWTPRVFIQFCDACLIDSGVTPFSRIIVPVDQWSNERCQLFFYELINKLKVAPEANLSRHNKDIDSGQMCDSWIFQQRLLFFNDSIARNKFSSPLWYWGVEEISETKISAC